MAAPPLPIVSLDAPDQVVAKDIHEACTKYGFLYVSNHGILTEVTDAMSSAIQAFFALPLDAKLCIVADSNNRGYTPFREETLDPAHQTTGDTKEGLYFGREVAPDSPEAATPLHGPNQWPDEVHPLTPLDTSFCATPKTHMLLLHTVSGARLSRSHHRLH